jgi:hypothetical protein
VAVDVCGISTVEVASERLVEGEAMEPGEEKDLTQDV